MSTAVQIQDPKVRDLRCVLQNELVRRIKDNPRYSLRAFARSLEIDPSLLSKVLNGKRGASRKVFERLVTHLGLSGSETALLCREPASQAIWSGGKAIDGGYRNVSADEFQIISDWFHYAIFELMNVKNYRPSPRWMARALEVSVEQVLGALNRMERAGLIARNAKGFRVRTNQSITNIGNNISAAPFRILQKQILEKAIQAVDEVALDKRDQTSMTMAIDPALLPEAKEVIRRFRRDLSAFLQKSPDRSEVYNLSISLYPVSKCSEVQTP